MKSTKWQFIFVHGLEKLIWLKWHPQVDQDIQCNHFWNPKGLFFCFCFFFSEIGKLILKFRRPRTLKALKKITKLEDSHLSVSEYKVIVIKTVWYSHQDRHGSIEQNSKMRNKLLHLL